MNWLLIPVCAVLYRLGGSKHKAYRRILIPIVLAGFSYFKTHDLIPCALMLASYLVFFRLPFTLIGDDVNACFINWFWVPVWALCLTVPSVFVTESLTAWLIPAAVITVFSILSNLPQTRQIVTWPFCELVFGAALAAGVAM